MRGSSRPDDGWDEGRRDRQDGRESWPAGNGYQPGASGGYPATGRGTGAGHAGQEEYGARALGPWTSSGTAGYPPPPYPGAGQGAAGHAAGGHPGTGYDPAAGYAGSGRVSGGYGATGQGRHAQGGPWHPGDPWHQDSGYVQPGQAGRPSPGGPEILAAGDPASANENAAGTPRPYGRLSIFTLLDDKAAEFDRLAELAAEGVRTAEPDTLVYVIHVVPKAAMQRIVYEIYRDRAAFESHERQPHIRRFVADRRSCVLATNVIDLRLKYAKVAALAAASEPPAPAQETQIDPAPRVPRALPSGTPPPAGPDGPRYPAGAAGQYPAGNGQYRNGQYRNGQYRGGQPVANGQYAAGNGQYTAVDRAVRHGGP